LELTNKNIKNKDIKTMKEFYTLAELSNMFYLALTSYKNAQTAAEKYAEEEDDFIMNFVEYTKTKYDELMKLIQTLDAFDDVTDYIGGLRKDGTKKYYINK
jgi:hypothetical protein